jgi:hypothetical protein
MHPVHAPPGPRTIGNLSFLRHERHLRVRPPRVKLPDASLRPVALDFKPRQRSLSRRRAACKTSVNRRVFSLFDNERTRDGCAAANIQGRATSDKNIDPARLHVNMDCSCFGFHDVP